MSRATPDDQLKFLLSCVRHSNNGKIDFVEVARECGVVSKGAAAKRYERLLKANGIHPSGGLTEKDKLSAPTAKQKSKTSIAKSADAKRRKIEGDTYDIKTDQEDDFMPFLKPEPLDFGPIKSEIDSVFQPYVYPHVPVPTPQPFFPRPTTTTPNVMGHRAFTPMLSHRPATPNLQTPVSTPMFAPVPQRVPFPTPKFPVPSQYRTTPSSQSTMSVPEEHISAMFDEFCGQDLFKRPGFDPAIPSHPGLAFSDPSVINQCASSPRTIDSAVSNFQELPSYSLGLQQESESTPMMTMSPAPVTEERRGKGIDDSILIMD